MNPRSVVRHVVIPRRISWKELKEIRKRESRRHKIKARKQKRIKKAARTARRVNRDRG